MKIEITENYETVFKLKIGDTFSSDTPEDFIEDVMDLVKQYLQKAVEFDADIDIRIDIPDIVEKEVI